MDDERTIQRRFQITVASKWPQSNWMNYTGLYNRVFWALGSLVFIGMTAKGHFSGVIYDEAFTVDKFAQSLFAAWSTYSFKNNHLINSFLVHYSQELFPWYEHSLRVPALMSAAVSLLCWGMIVRLTIASWAVRFGVFGLLVLNVHFFDLMYLARGYTFAQSGMFLAILFMLLYVRGHIELTRLLVLIPAFNTLAIGAVLTHALVMVPLNAVFLLAIFRRRFSESCRGDAKLALRRSAVDTLVAATVIAGLSALALMALYLGVLENIFKLLGEPRRVGFWPFITSIIRLWFPVGYLQWFVVLLLLSYFITSRLWQIRLTGFVGSTINEKRFIVYVFLAVLLSLWIYIDVLSKRVPFSRNLSFLLPLLILFAGVLIDDGLRHMGRFGQRLSLIILCCSLAPALVRNFPSPYAIAIEKDWKQQSCSGPLARVLNNIDPSRTWNIHVSRESIYTRTALEYYRRRGYRIMTDPHAQADVEVLHMNRVAALDGSHLLKPNYFIRFECVIVKQKPF